VTGIFCGGDDSSHYGAVPVAVLRAIADGHIITAGSQLRQSRVWRNSGVDDSDALTHTAGEFPNLLQIERGQLGGVDGCIGLSIEGRYCTDLTLDSRLWWACRCGLWEAAVVNRRR
jgi:hypothetical protein